MDPSGLGLGGVKAGGAVDPLTFVKKPTVVLRLLALLFAIIVFGCISSEGWQFHQEQNKEICIMNGSSSACNFGNTVAVIAFLAAIGFIVGEYMYEKMSSIKSRKHFLWADIGFSGLWSFFFLVSFCIMAHQWAVSNEPPAGVGHSDMVAAIFFSFLSVLVWGVCAFLSFQRFKAGFDTAFGGGIDEEALRNQGATQGYQAYQQEGYSDPPFNQPAGDTGGYSSVQY